MTTPSAEPGTTMPPRPQGDAPRSRSSSDRSAEAVGSTAALAQVIATLSPVAARRASVRFAVVDHCLRPSDVDIATRVDALAAAVLAELGSALADRPTTGADAAAQAGSILDAIPGLDAVAFGLRHQHERWDGSGEPAHLAGTDIPVIARLVAVGSVVADLITSADDSLDVTSATDRIHDLNGTHLDPTFCRACVDAIEQGAFARVPTLDEQLEQLASLRPAGRRPFDALSSISAAISAVDDLADVVALIADEARREVGASSVSVGRYRSQRGEVEVLVNVGTLEPGQVRFPNEEIHPFEVPPSARLRATTLASPDGQSAGVIAAPVHSRHKLWGFVLARTGGVRGPFDSSDLQILDQVATELAQAVDKVERLAEVIDMALRDPLTGLANRRVLDQRLGAIFDRPLENRVDCALIMCDLDGLKVINDTQGHTSGDKVLIDVATQLRSAVAAYPSSEVCRIGGDEFCIVIERGGRREADQIGKRIDELVARLDDPPVSVSCGIAAVSSTTHTASDLLRAADEAQYAVKRARQGSTVASRGSGRRERRE
jgi:diguanylate cyclase (GGDEF)-like protein